MRMLIPGTPLPIGQHLGWTRNSRLEAQPLLSLDMSLFCLPGSAETRRTANQTWHPRLLSSTVIQSLFVLRLYRSSRRSNTLKKVPACSVPGFRRIIFLSNMDRMLNFFFFILITSCNEFKILLNTHCE